MNIAWLIPATLLLIPTAAAAQTLPTPATDDLWDISQGTVVTANSELRAGFDGRDMLGGDFGGIPFEVKSIVFADHQPKDTIHAIDWKTAAPIRLESFRVFAWHNVSRSLNDPCTYPDARVRGFKVFRLFAKNSGGQWEQIYELDPLVNGHYRISNPEYQGILNFDRPINIKPFLHEGTVTPVTAQEWRAEFVQGGDPDDTTQCTTWRNATGPRVVELDGFGEVAPPEPEPEREPVVIVPGLVGSHNPECILQDRCAPNVGTWDFTPTVDWYDPLIMRLESEGYEQGRDLFIAYYDWRQSNIESAVEYLKPKIDEALAASGASKVDIVAHSMGGLVARAYVQSGPAYRGDVDQLIMLGTPNEGAADAYTVLESGELPTRWGFAANQWIRRIDRSLKQTRNRKSLARTKSFREFFPSLRELIPINAFVLKETTFLNPNELALGDNLFLQALRNTAGRLADINVLTIAGAGHGTLDKVAITNNRSPEDIALERWRDGHADPDPPQEDSTAGDQTVLTASAQAVGNPLAPLDALHEELPGKTQDLVAQALLENPIGDFVPVNLASSGLGIDVLSPVMPTIHGPNGEILSATENTFENAVFDWDTGDPNSIKMLTILDPPPGAYAVNYVGTGEGEYTIITTYADADETITTERSGITSAATQGSFAITLDQDSIIVPPEDILLLAEELREAIKDLKKEGHIRGKAFGNLNGAAGHLQGKAKSYKENAQQYGNTSVEAQKKFAELQQAFAKFAEGFQGQMGLGLLDSEAIITISGYVQRLEDAGL